MDSSLKELAKLEKLTDPGKRSKGKSVTVFDTLGTLLAKLQDTKNQVEAGTCSPQQLTELAKFVEHQRKEVEDRQKDVYQAMNKYNKALDKKFSSQLPTYPPLFTSPESVSALQHTVALHLLRTGQFETAETFLAESGIELSTVLQNQFLELHRIVIALKNQDIGPALEWTCTNYTALDERAAALEFKLHQSHYLRLLLSTSNPQTALSYAQTYFPPLYSSHSSQINRLMACIAYLPHSRLQKSPFADLASSDLAHADLVSVFMKEYCAVVGLSRQVPLRVVGDIGGGGALARIEKGRKIMRDRKSEWSQSDELPIEVPVPPENRYHSIFSCPVSKEQATEDNPPMMMTCGHVLTRESLHKLVKPAAPGRVKCPYCPTESAEQEALRVYF